MSQPIRDPLEALGFRMTDFVMSRWVLLLGELVFLLLMVSYQTQPLNMTQPFDMALASGVLSGAIVVNGYFWFLSRRQKKLSQNGVFLQLCFDIAQLSLLLFAVGGLATPLVSFYFIVTCVSSMILLPKLSFRVFLAVAVASGLVHWFTGGDIYFWLGLIVALAVLWLNLNKIGGKMHKRYEALVATQTALADEERLAALGALSTAAAHELGTPLGTITLAASEAMNDMDADNPYREDMAVIAQEALRCREILKHLSSSHADEREDLLRRLPIEALVQLAIDNHKTLDREIIIKLQGGGASSGEQPMVSNRPEIIHGIGNFIENAVGFSNQTIEIHISWDDADLRLSILDDGPGFDNSVVDKLGEPYISTRSEPDSVDETMAGGLGLGVFIAKTLIERTGGSVSFRNGVMGGAQIDIVWPRKVFDDIGNNEGSPGGIPWELQ